MTKMPSIFLICKKRRGVKNDPEVDEFELGKIFSHTIHKS